MTAIPGPFRWSCRVSRSRAVGWLVALVLGLFAGTTAHAQWEFSPYLIRVWVTAPSTADFSAAVLDDLSSEIATQAAIETAPAWSTAAQRAPAAVEVELLDENNPPTFDRLFAADKSLSRADKLFVVSFRPETGLEKATLREFDIRFRVWSPPRSIAAPQRDGLAESILTNMLDLFAPLARIEKVDGKKVVAKLRAHGMLVSDDAPGRMKTGDVLLPCVRRTSRSGDGATTAVDVPPWTYLRIDSVNESTIETTTHTGIGQPIPAKGGARVERLAMLVRRPHPSSLLKLQSRDRLKTPLAGYEIFAKIPGQDDPIALGVTNYRGEFFLPADEHPLKVLYLKNGGQLLGRLPVSPGSVERYTLSLPNDDRRLEVEGIVRAMQIKITDAVVRRETLFLRIRDRIAKGDVAKAKLLLEELKLIATRADLQQELERRQQEILPSLPPGEKLTQKRVEKLFSDAQLLLGKFLDPAAIDKIANEVIAAAGAAPPPADTPAGG